MPRAKKSVVEVPVLTEEPVLDEEESFPVVRTDDLKLSLPHLKTLPHPDNVVSFFSTLIGWVLLAAIACCLLVGVWWVFFSLANSFTHFTIVSVIGLLLVVLGGVYVALRHFGVIKEWKKLS